jgi:hypothetical protein
MNRLIQICSVIIIGFFLLSANAPLKVSVVFDKKIPQVEFAVQELQKAWLASYHRVYS